jgi:hypothetical protein
MCDVPSGDEEREPRSGNLNRRPHTASSPRLHAAAPIDGVARFATSIAVCQAALSTKFLIETLGQLSERRGGPAKLPVLFFQLLYGCEAILQSRVMFIVDHTAPSRTDAPRSKTWTVSPFTDQLRHCP